MSHDSIADIAVFTKLYMKEVRSAFYHWSVSGGGGGGLLMYMAVLASDWSTQF